MKRAQISGVLVAGMVSLTWPRMARAERCADGSTMQPERGSNDGTTDTAPPAREDCIERDIVMMPGAFVTYFQPTANLGGFYGGGVQFAPYQWSRNNDRFGPSQGGMTVQAAFLSSPRTAGTMGLFEVGLNASLERNSSRRFLIPYFGATIGAMTQSDLGTSMYAYPNGGVHLYYHRNLMVDAEGGYHFPFKDIEETRGPRAQISMRFSLW